MPDNAVISFAFAGLPEGYCFTDFNRLALDITAGMTGFVPGQYSVIITSESEPAASDRDKLWYKLLGGGAPGGKLYAYYSGKWVAPNPIAPSSDERRMFQGIEADIWSYDGGDGSDPGAVAPTASTGAMWEKDSDFDFRVPIGAGTSPVVSITLEDGSTTTYGGTTVNVGDDDGAEFQQLNLSQLPAIVPKWYNSSNAGGFSADIYTGIADTQWGFVGDHDTVPVLWGVGDRIRIDGPNKEAVSKMPPTRGTFFIKRTARIYYQA